MEKTSRGRGMNQVGCQRRRLLSIGSPQVWLQASKSWWCCLRAYLTALGFGGPSCLLQLILILQVTIFSLRIVLIFDKVLLVHLYLVLNFSSGPCHPICVHSFGNPREMPVRESSFRLLCSSVFWKVLLPPC